MPLAAAQVWTAVGSLATAVGVLAVFVELAAGRRQRRTELEDGLSREYRTIAAARKRRAANKATAS